MVGKEGNRPRGRDGGRRQAPPVCAPESTPLSTGGGRAFLDGVWAWLSSDDRYSILHSLGPQKTRNIRHVQYSFTFYKHIHSNTETSKIQRSHVTVRVHDEQAHSIDPVTHQLRKCFCVWTGIFPMYIHSVLSFKYDTVPLMVFCWSCLACLPCNEIRMEAMRIVCCGHVS